MKNKKNWFSRLASQIIPKKDEKFTYFTVKDSNYEDTFDRIGKWKLTKKNLYKKQAIIAQITQDASEFREIGETDGWRGLTPQAMEKITANIASLWKSFIESSFHHRKILAEGNQADYKTQYDNLVRIQDSLKNHKADIDEHYKNNSKQYSLFFGLLYIGAAIFLLIADFPLAVQSAQKGFNLNNDEAFWIATGLVMMTAYIKIIYDEYLGNSVKKTLESRREEINLGDEKPATTEEIKAAKRIRAWQLISKLLILTLLVGTIITLGVFRFGFLQIDAGPTGNISKYANAIDSLSGKYAFILTSIIFPIIGGVCASVGFRNMRNVLDRFLIQVRIRLNQRKKKNAHKKKLIADGMVKECEENIKWVTDDLGFLKECANYFFSCYLHGYNRGINLRMPEDFYDVAEHARSRNLMQNSSEFLGNRFLFDPDQQFADKFQKQLNP